MKDTDNLTWEFEGMLFPVAPGMDNIHTITRRPFGIQSEAQAAN